MNGTASMRIGVQHGIADPNWSPATLSPSALTSFARTAEECGYGAIGFTDHPAPSARWVSGGGEGSADPFASLAFCAAVTQRIRLLTWVLAAGYRNPLFAAHQISTVDRLSAGRLTVGLGTGYLRGEFRAAGADFERRRAALDELLDLLPAAWNETIEGEGVGWTAPGNVVQPPPVQSPRPPVWIHGNGAWGTARAARADGWIGVITTEPMTRTIRTTAIPDHAALAAAIDRVLGARDRLGRASMPFDIVVTAALPTFDVRRPWNVEQVRDQIGRLQALGTTWLMINVIGDDPAASVATIQQFADDFIAEGAPSGDR